MLSGHYPDLIVEQRLVCLGPQRLLGFAAPQRALAASWPRLASDALPSSTTPRNSRPWTHYSRNIINEIAQFFSEKANMKRRDFLKLGAGVPTHGRPSACHGFSRGSKRLRLALGSGPRQRLTPLSDVDAFNYVIGTQTIGATYQFTQQSVLVETARAILDMGSNVVKFTMGRDYQRMMLKPSKAAYPETMQYLLNQGSDARGALRTKYPGAAIEPPPANPAIRTLTDLARLEPSYRQVFEMPFAYYLIWTYAFAPGWWNRGFSAEEQEMEYQEIRQFVAPRPAQDL